MAYLKGLSLAIVVVSILVGFGHTFSPPGTIEEAITAFHVARAHAQAIESPTGLPTLEIATPTDTPSFEESVTASATPTFESTATETSTPTPSSTDAIASQTPADTETPTPTLSQTVQPTNTVDATPQATETVIGPEGGQITSLDGDAEVTFPPGAVVEPVMVRVTQMSAGDLPSALPAGQPENTWDFSAFAIERENEPVHEFAVPLIVDLRYDNDELFGKATQSLRYFSYDEAQDNWLESPVTFVEPGRYRVTLNHFSTQASTLDDTIKLPAVLDQAQVNLSTGAATFSFPIQVASGVGKVTPQFNLTYNSASADESHAAGSWVGTGWDLSAPSISRSGDRYYLNLNGVGTEILKIGTEYIARSQRFWHITRTCPPATGSCWTVRDTSGNTYTFGGTADSRRFYSQPGVIEEYYQWDLSLMTDAHGNQADYDYAQTFGVSGDPPYNLAPHVISSYLDKVTYPGGEIDFEVKNDTNSPGWLQNAHWYRTSYGGSWLRVRPDIKECGGPLVSVTETQALHKIIVKSWDVNAFYTARSYLFDYESIDSAYQCGGTQNLGLTLKSVIVEGRDGGSLHKLDFENVQKQTFEVCPRASGSSLSWTSKRLQKVKNGFGGETSFTYAATPVGFQWPSPTDKACDGDDSPRFQHFVVTGMTQSAGSAWASGQSPDVTHTFSYLGSPQWKVDGALDADNPYGIRSVFTGFAEVHVTDSQGNKNKTYFVTTGEQAGVATKQETWGNEPTPVLWHSVETTPVVVTQTATFDIDYIELKTAGQRIARATAEGYQPALKVGEVIVISGVPDGSYNGRFYNGAFKITFVDHHCGSNCSTEFWYVMDGIPTGDAQGGSAKKAARPVVAGTENVTTRSKGMSSGYGSRTTYAYDIATGMVSSTTEDGDISTSTNPDCRITEATYTKNLSTTGPRFILPSTSSVKSCAGGATPEAESASFYDGTTSLSATPTKGNPTASRQTVDIARNVTHPEKYVYTYSSYSTTGQPLASSVPLYGNEAAIIGGGTEGTVPTTKGRTVLTYDALANDSIQTGLSGPGRFVTSAVTYVYDENGNAASPATQVVSTTWDRKLGVPLTAIDASGMESKSFYDQFGRRTGTWRTLDSVSSGTPVPAVEYTYSWGVASTPVANPDGNNMVTVKQRPTTTTTTVLEQRHCLDGLGRKRHSVVPFGNGKALTQYTYDARGLQTNTQTYGIHPTNWCLIGVDSNSGPNHFVQHDPMGRPATTTNSDPGSPVACPASTTVGCSRVEHSSNYVYTLTRTFDENGRKTETLTDGLGRVYKTSEFDDVPSEYSSTTFEYDIRGNLTKVDPISGVSGDETIITYDALGRKLTMIDPDMSGYWQTTPTLERAPWTYKYDAAGNLIEQTDARRAPGQSGGVGVKTVLQYDSLNRLKSKTYTAPSPSWTPSYPTVPPLPWMRPNVSFTYDSYDTSDGFCSTQTTPAETAIGRLTKSTDGEVTTKYCYDIRGREVSRKLTLTPNNTLSGCSGWTRSYTTSRTYDLGDRLATLTYPVDNEVLTYDYKDTSIGGGQLDSITSSLGVTYASSLLYHVSGAPSSATFGNGMVTTHTRDTRYRLSEIKSVLSGVTKQQLANYTYDKVGNITRINDTVNSEDQKYEYDFLDRLTKMTINGSSTPTASYIYNAAATYGGTIGNMTSKTEGSTRTMTYSAEHIHAPLEANTTYDKNGNAAVLGSDTYAFDVENRVARIDNWSGYFLRADYAYDVGGEMAFRRTTSWYYGGVDTKYTYMDGIYQERSINCGASVETTKLYMALGRVIAQRQGSSLSYLVADHLGSTTGTMDSSGYMPGMRYYPFGSPRAGTASTSRLYTGQQSEMNALGSNVYYYHARFYSPEYAHFVSADSTALDGFNRFAYVMNNPLRYRDETGKCTDCHTPIPQPLPVVPSAPFPDAGTPVPGVSQEEWNACMADTAACLYWSVGGDPEQFIRLVAQMYEVDVYVLAAIVLNEYAHYDWIDSVTDEYLVDLPIDRARNSSRGLAQLRISNAVLLADSGLVPSADEATHGRRLQNPLWSIIYAAAQVRYVGDYIARQTGRAALEADLFVAYEDVGIWTRSYKDTGCGYCSDEAWDQASTVDDHYDPQSVNRLAGVLAGCVSQTSCKVYTP